MLVLQKIIIIFSAIGVFLVWGELMLMIGRLPTFGIYVQMFTTVAKNFAKFLAAYFCLLVAFALSFLVLFPNYRSFNVPVPAAIGMYTHFREHFAKTSDFIQLKPISVNNMNYTQIWIIV